MTKRKLKNMVQVLLESNIELMGNIESYKRMVKEANIRSSQLLEELKYAKRNEPIFTADRYEKRILTEENKQYKELNKALKEENFRLMAQLEATAKKKSKGTSKS